MEKLFLFIFNTRNVTYAPNNHTHPHTHIIIITHTHTHTHTQIHTQQKYCDTFGMRAPILKQLLSLTNFHTSSTLHTSLSNSTAQVIHRLQRSSFPQNDHTEYIYNSQYY